MSYYYNPKVTYSSQEDDNFGMSEDSYIDSEPMKASGSVDKESLEYKKRRQKNNEAVRRSREKSKIKYNEKEEQIMRLRKENKQLESEAANLRNELKIYQDMARDMDIQVIDEVNMGNSNLMIKLERDFADY